MGGTKGTNAEREGRGREGRQVGMYNVHTYKPLEVSLIERRKVTEFPVSASILPVSYRAVQPPSQYICSWAWGSRGARHGGVGSL